MTILRQEETLSGESIKTFSKYHADLCTFDQIDEFSLNLSGFSRMRELYNEIKTLSIYKINSNKYPIPSQQNRICVVKYRNIYIPISSYIASGRDHVIEAHAKHFQAAVMHAVALIKFIEAPTLKRDTLSKEDSQFIMDLEKKIADYELVTAQESGYSSSASSRTPSPKGKQSPYPTQKRTPSPTNYATIATTLSQLKPEQVEDYTAELCKLSQLLNRNHASLEFIERSVYRIGTEEIRLKINIDHVLAIKKSLLPYEHYHAFFAALCMSLPEENLIPQLIESPSLFLAYLSKASDLNPFVHADVTQSLWACANIEHKAIMIQRALASNKAVLLEGFSREINTDLELISRVLGNITHLQYDQFKLISNGLTTEALELHKAFLKKNRPLLNLESKQALIEEELLSPEAEKPIAETSLFRAPAPSIKELIDIETLTDLEITQLIDQGELKPDTRVKPIKRSALANLITHGHISSIQALLPKYKYSAPMLVTVLNEVINKAKLSVLTKLGCEALIKYDAEFDICCEKSFNPTLFLQHAFELSPQQISTFCDEHPEHMIQIYTHAKQYADIAQLVSVEPQLITQTNPNDLDKIICSLSGEQLEDVLDTPKFTEWFSQLSPGNFELFFEKLLSIHDLEAYIIIKLMQMTNSDTLAYLPHSKETVCTLLTKQQKNEVIEALIKDGSESKDKKSKAKKSKRVTLTPIQLTLQETNDKGENILHIAVYQQNFWLVSVICEHLCPELAPQLFNQRQVDGHTPFDLAVRSKKVYPTRAIGLRAIELGASSVPVIAARNFSKQLDTYLKKATFSGFASLYNFINKAGATDIFQMGLSSEQEWSIMTLFMSEDDSKSRILDHCIKSEGTKKLPEEMTRYQLLTNPFRDCILSLNKHYFTTEGLDISGLTYSCLQSLLCINIKDIVKLEDQKQKTLIERLIILCNIVLRNQLIANHMKLMIIKKTALILYKHPKHKQYMFARMVHSLSDDHCVQILDKIDSIHKIAETSFDDDYSRSAPTAVRTALDYLKEALTAMKDFTESLTDPITHFVETPEYWYLAMEYQKPLTLVKLMSWAEQISEDSGGFRPHATHLLTTINSQGQSILQLAIKHAASEVISEFIKYDKVYQEVAPDEALYKTQYSCGNTLLMLAVIHKNIEMIKHIASLELTLDNTLTNRSGKTLQKLIAESSGVVQAVCTLLIVPEVKEVKSTDAEDGSSQIRPTRTQSCPCPSIFTRKPPRSALAPLNRAMSHENGNLNLN